MVEGDRKDHQPVKGRGDVEEERPSLMKQSRQPDAHCPMATSVSEEDRSQL